MKADINVTPLVDIVLVLLIIFIVITPAVHNAVQLPAARNSRPPQRERGADDLTLILGSHRDSAGTAGGPGRVLVDGPNAKDALGRPLAFDLADPADRGRLVAFVQQASRMGGRRVLVKADRDLPFRQVNDLLQICREGGAVEVDAVTREERPAGNGGR